MGGQVCKIEDCDKPVRARGLCSRHYRLEGCGTICSVDGCGRPHYALGYCERDYQRLRATGSAQPPDMCARGIHLLTPDNVITSKTTGKRRCKACHAGWLAQRERPECSLDACRDPVKARGWCGRHYRNWQTFGDPLGPLPVDREDLPGETWLPIPGWEGLYEVSDHGRVWSIRSGRLLTPYLNDYGYPTVALCRSRTSEAGRQATTPVHRAEASAFLGPKPKGLGVRHLDGNSENNMLSNLLYGTQKQNMHDAIEHGTHESRRTIAMVAERDSCVNGHEYIPGGFYFNSAGSKICRKCDIAKADRYHARQQAATA